MEINISIINIYIMNKILDVMEDINIDATIDSVKNKK